MPTRDPVILATCPTEPEAVLIADILTDNGIEAVVTGGSVAGFRAEAPAGARVLVHKDDHAQAQANIAEVEKDAANIDWSKVDLGQPEEGSGIEPE